MSRCAAVRRAGSKEPCTLPSLEGVDFCGRHVRARNPQRWIELYDTRSITRIQALVRGHLVRRQIRWAGPGALKRAVCVNDEDLATLDEKDRVSPLDYFGWTEAGKVWWMQVPSILQLIRAEPKPVNPYTKVPFSLDDRRRLRRIHFYRARHELPISHMPVNPQESTQVYLTLVCQCMEENGYDPLAPDYFRSFSPIALLMFLDRLILQLRGASLEASPHQGWRSHRAARLRTVYAEFIHRPTYVRWAVARALAYLFAEDRESPNVAFWIASALVQVES